MLEVLLGWRSDAPKGKGRRKRTQKPNCTKGRSCGLSCVDRDDECRPDLSPILKAAADSIARSGGSSPAGVVQANKATTAAPQGTVQAVPINLKAAQAEAKRLANADYEQRENAKNIVLAAQMIEAGRKFVGNTLTSKPTGNAALRAEVAKLEAAYDKVAETADDPFSTPQWKAFIKARNELKTAEGGDAASSPMAAVRDKLLNRTSPTDAAEAADKVKILKTAATRYGEEELRSQLTEFYRLTGGKGANLSALKVTEARAWADSNENVVNMGKYDQDKAAPTLYHEVGHIIENWDLKTLKAMQGFRAARAEGDAAPLRGYDSDERAYPGRYIDPYVGKVHRGGNGGATEVLSVGLEHFTSPESMANLYRQDPEHFFLTIGALL